MKGGEWSAACNTLCVYRDMVNGSQWSAEEISPTPSRVSQTYVSGRFYRPSNNVGDIWELGVCDEP